MQIEELEIPIVHHPVRRCTQCRAILSQSNKGDICRHHIKAPSMPEALARATREAKSYEPGNSSNGIDPNFGSTQILNAACVCFDVGVKDIWEQNGMEALLAGEVAAFLILNKIGPSGSWIGRFLHREFSMALRSHKRVKAALDSGDPLSEKVVAVQDLYPSMSGDTFPLFEKRKRIPPSRIFESVASQFDIMPEQIFVRRNSRPIVFPRQIATYCLHTIAKRTFQEIAGILGQDHTTVMHSCEVIATAMEGDSPVRNIVESTRALCLQNDEAA